MTLTCTVDASGIRVPTYPEVLAELQARYRAIYGTDAYLEADSQDGQFLALIASALNDSNSVAAAVYNAFSPATAQGEGLSRMVKINGLRRATPTRSTVDLRLVGQVGTQITNGIVRDAAGQRWRLPASVIIPNAGEIVVTATAERVGAIRALPNTITQIATPTRGWQTVTNPQAATAGAPVESDAALRRRQAISTALPSRTTLASILGGLLTLDNVERAVVLENDTALTSAEGIPPHSIAAVVEGGDATKIAELLFLRKTLGTGTFGSTSVTVQDANGVPRTVKFSRPTIVPITVEITLTALSGYTTAVGDRIKQVVANRINDYGIGDDSLLSRLWSAATLPGDVRSTLFDITQVRQKRGAEPLAAGNVTIAWNEAASCTVSDVTVIAS